MKRLIFFLMLILSTQLIVFAEPNFPKKIISQISDQFFKAEQIKDFDSASELFHYPPTYTIEELEKDKVAIKSVLEYYYQSFGKILSYKMSKKPELYLGLSIGGGDLPYWAKNPVSFRIVYEVRFSNDGKGYVVIDLCNINNKYEIRSVQYGLPVSRDDCEKRIKEIYDGMMQVLSIIEKRSTV